MWIYSQKTGELRRDDNLIGCGYSGKGECKNNPDAQNVHNRGPIPRGLYKIGIPMTHWALGPYSLPLFPAMDNQMYGRNGFFIHGDSTVHPGQASDGCIVLDRPIREQIIQSGDEQLEVTE